MEIFNRRRVSVVEAVAEKSSNQRGLPDSCRPDYHQPEAVSGRNVGVLDDQPRYRRRSVRIGIGIGIDVDVEVCVSVSDDEC